MTQSPIETPSSTRGLHDPSSATGVFRCPARPSSRSAQQGRQQGGKLIVCGSGRRVATSPPHYTAGSGAAVCRRTFGRVPAARRIVPLLATSRFTARRRLHLRRRLLWLRALGCLIAPPHEARGSPRRLRAHFLRGGRRWSAARPFFFPSAPRSSRRPQPPPRRPPSPPRALRPARIPRPIFSGDQLLGGTPGPSAPRALGPHHHLPGTDRRRPRSPRPSPLRSCPHERHAPLLQPDLHAAVAAPFALPSDRRKLHGNAAHGSCRRLWDPRRRPRRCHRRCCRRCPRRSRRAIPPATPHASRSIARAPATAAPASPSPAASRPPTTSLPESSARAPGAAAATRPTCPSTRGGRTR